MKAQTSTKNLCETCGKVSPWVRYSPKTHRFACDKCRNAEWNETVKDLRQRGLIK